MLIPTPVVSPSNIRTIDGAWRWIRVIPHRCCRRWTVTLEYNWFKNFPQHVLELTQGSGTSFSLVYKYNLIDQGGRTLLAPT